MPFESKLLKERRREYLANVKTIEKTLKTAKPLVKATEKKFEIKLRIINEMDVPFKDDSFISVTYKANKTHKQLGTCQDDFFKLGWMSCTITADRKHIRLGTYLDYKK